MKRDPFVQEVGEFMRLQPTQDTILTYASEVGVNRLRQGLNMLMRDLDRQLAIARADHASGVASAAEYDIDSLEANYEDKRVGVVTFKSYVVDAASLLKAVETDRIGREASGRDQVMQSVLNTLERIEEHVGVLSKQVSHDNESS